MDSKNATRLKPADLRNMFGMSGLKKKKSQPKVMAAGVVLIFSSSFMQESKQVNLPERQTILLKL